MQNQEADPVCHHDKKMDSSSKSDNNSHLSSSNKKRKRKIIEEIFQCKDCKSSRKLCLRHENFENEWIHHVVRCFKMPDKDRVIEELNKAFEIDQAIHLKVSKKIREFSRKFELPAFLVPSILQNLRSWHHCQTIGFDARMNLAQALKYGVRNNLDIEYKELLELLFEGDSDEIKSEIVWTLGFKVKNSTKGLTNELVAEISGCVSIFLAPEGTAFLRSQIMRHDYLRLEDDCKKSLDTRFLGGPILGFIYHYKLSMALEDLYDLDWSFEELTKVLKKIESNPLLRERIQKPLFQTLEALVQFRIPASIGNIFEILGENVKGWTRKTIEFAMEMKFQANIQVKNHQELVAELESMNAENYLDYENLEQGLILVKYDGLKTGVDLKKHAEKVVFTLLLDIKPLANFQYPISKWTRAEISEWAKVVKLIPDSLYASEFVVEALAVIKQANFLETGFHFTDTQILSCLFQLDAGLTRGRLLQVGTGEGKSTIVSVLAIIHALRGRKVDIITSSPVLAERDAKEKANLYKIFGLSCTDNGDKVPYIKGPKDCYKQDIVYGEIAQFQFDTLRDKYSMLGTLGGRECEVAIIDEVDCMLIDDSSNIARLSSTIAGMDLLQPFMHFLWQRLGLLHQELVEEDGKTFIISDEEDSREDLFEDSGVESEGNVVKFLKKELESYLREDLIKGGRIAVPNNFKEFVEKQISHWIENAMKAFLSQEDQEYVIQDGVVNPVAYDSTGIVQSSTSWGGGLHQLIQRKHGLKMTSENCTTNFLSNIGYIKKYGSNIFGLTGTLGSYKAQQVLSKVYEVDLVKIPLLHKKQYLEYAPKICDDRESWVEEICSSVLYEVKKQRGVLVLCQTIEQCKFMSHELGKRYRKRAAIKLYTMNNANQESAIGRINPGEIIVATNLAGRGTDIKTDEIENNGGLHVIVTFLPPNQRVEEQAFGRTARQGKRGTGQMILNRGALLRYGVYSAKRIKSERDYFESKMFDEFMKKELKTVTIKDALFIKFCHLKYIICQNVKASTGLLQKLKRSSAVYETNILKALEERWALFLHKIENQIISLDESMKEYNSFEKEIFEDFRKDKLIKNPYYHIRIANDLLMNNSLFESSQEKQALENLEEAIKLDPKQSATAFVGKAFIEIKTKKKEDLEKSRVMNYLIEALKLLSDEMSLLNYFQAVLQEEYLDMNCDLSKQLIEKITILGSYMNSLQNALTVIKKSQRLIDITGIIEGKKIKVISNFYDLERDEKTREIVRDLGKHDKFKVVFHDLTKLDESNEDKDQAIKTIRNAAESFQSEDRPRDDKIKSFFNKLVKNSEMKGSASIYKEFAIALNELNYTGIKELLDPDVRIVNVSKDKALAKLKEYACEVDLKSMVDGKIDKYRTKSKVKEVQEIIKKSCNEKETFSITFRNANKTAKKLKEEILKSSILTLEIMNLNCEHAKNKLKKMKSKSLHLEISGMKREISRALLHSRIQYVQLLRDSDSNDVVAVIEVDLAREMISQKKDEQLWVKIENLDTISAEQIVNICSNAIFQLTFIDVDLVDILEVSEEEAPISVNINFTKLSSDVAIKLVQILRKLSFDFTLALSNLNTEQLKEVIKNASLEQEELEITKVRKLCELFPDNARPNLELAEFAARGVEHIFEINEKRFIPWRSVMAVAAVGSLQVALGSFLITTGFGASSGIGLVTEGAADYITAYRAYKRRHFTWSDYAKQKAVSLAISAVCVGAGRLKDGFKGINTVISGIKREAIEQAGTQVLVNSQSLKTVLWQTGKSLQKLSMHQVAVTTSEVVIREGLNTMTGSLVNFTLEKFRPEISPLIQKKVEAKFSEEGSLKILIQKMYALDKIRNSAAFSIQIKNIAQDIVHPERNRNSDMWDSIGMPLCQGVLSGYTLVNIFKTFSGLAEIGFMIDKFHSEFVKKLVELDKKELSIEMVFHRYGNGKISFEEGIEICKTLKAKGVIVGSLNCEIIYPERLKQGKIDLGKHNETVLKFCEDLHKYSSITSSNEIMKFISDMITEKIIRVTESHLISPWSASMVGNITSNVSANLQNRMIQDQLKNDQYLLSKRFKKKIRKEYRNENKLITYSDLINHQANRHTIIYTQCENINAKMQRKLNGNLPKPANKKANNLAQQNQKPADQEKKKKERLYSFKNVAGTVIKITIKITQAGEIILKAKGAEADSRLSYIMTAAKIVRITAVGLDMANNVISSAFDNGILSGEFLSDILSQIEKNKLTIYEAANYLRLKCLEGVFSGLKDYGVSLKQLRTILDLIRICQKLKEGRTNLLKVILDIDTRQIFKKNEWKRYFRDTLGIVKRILLRIVKLLKFVLETNEGASKNPAMASTLKALNSARKAATNFGQVFEVINSAIEKGVFSQQFLMNIMQQIAKIDFTKLDKTPSGFTKLRGAEKIFLKLKHLKVPSQKLMRIKKIIKIYQRVKNRRMSLLNGIFDCFSQEFNDPKILAQIYQFCCPEKGEEEEDEDENLH